MCRCIMASSIRKMEGLYSLVASEVVLAFSVGFGGVWLLMEFWTEV